jgi:hypothetical protein
MHKHESLHLSALVGGTRPSDEVASISSEAPQIDGIMAVMALASIEVPPKSGLQERR